jgi:hypothetical protein
MMKFDAKLKVALIQARSAAFDQLAVGRGGEHSFAIDQAGRSERRGGVSRTYDAVPTARIEGTAVSTRVRTG